jgi:hypothetical protein
MRGFGYLISIVSVIMLGLVAWPRADDPDWHVPVVLLGMALSIGGMRLRWLESRHERGELDRVEQRTGLRQPAE